MLRKLGLITLFGGLSFVLISCGDDSKTGVTECDEVLEISYKYYPQLPDDKKELIKTEQQNLIDEAKKDPKRAKIACKIALEKLSSSAR